MDERGDDLIDEPSLETFPLNSRAMRAEEAWKGASRYGGKVGLFKVSHIGAVLFSFERILLKFDQVVTNMLEILLFTYQMDHQSGMDESDPRILELSSKLRS